MRWPACGTPPRGSWSTGLYFQICRTSGADELRLYTADTMYRWTFAAGLPTRVGDRGSAVERPPVLGGMRVSDRAVWDEGFCYIEPYDRGAQQHFLEGYRAGELTLSLAGVKLWGTFYLLRTGADAGEDSVWATCRLVSAERVA